MTARARTALLTFILLMAVGSTAVGQSSYPVVDIQVEGNRVASSSLILGASNIAKGSPLTPNVIQSSLKRLWGLGIFSDVRIEAEEVSGGIKVFIVVKELPKLIGMEFSGNKRYKDKTLLKEAKLGVGGYISPSLMHEATEKIKSYYSSKGYFRASVEPELTYSTDSTEATLTFSIKERSKVKVREVVLTGAERVKPRKIINKMRNRDRGFLLSSDFAQDKYEEDLEAVVKAYQKRGFLDAYVISDSTVIDTTANRMTIYLEVFEGPQYYFGKTTFSGNDVLKEETLYKLLKHDEGKVFNNEKYEESITELYLGYQEVGHIHARIIDERTTRADSVLDISYTISEGLPAHINLVKIAGNHRTKEHVIRRELVTRPGQIFSRSLLMRSIREAMALNYFSNVLPEPIYLPNGDVDIEFTVEEKQTGQINAGAGYNSTDKLVGSLGMGIPNFLGNGQDLSFNVEFGSNRNSMSVSFTEPWLFGRPTSLGIDVYALNRRWYDEYTEQRQGGAIRLGRRLRWPDDYFRVFTSYKLERNRFHDYDDDFLADNSAVRDSVFNWVEVEEIEVDGDTILQVTENSRTVEAIGEALPGTIVAYNERWNTASRWAFTLVRDSRNLPEFATKGSVMSYTFENTGGILGGFWEYQRHKLALTKFIPLIGRLSFGAKLEMGAITAANDDDKDLKILISDRFNPGGTAYDGIVRGYDDGTLTPDSLVSGADTVYYYYQNPDSLTPGTDADSTVVSDAYKTRVRGKYMVVANFELQFPIIKDQIYLLAFFDAGNSWLHWKDIKPVTGLYKGWGVGFRIAVPGIGTIGFDFGKPLDDPPDGDDRSWRPHFQLGTTFR